MKKLAKLFSIYNLSEMDSEKSDLNRRFEDLVIDVKQKRKLNTILIRANKRLKIAVNLCLVAILLISGIFAVNIYLNSDIKTFNYHYKNFKGRYISSYGLVLTDPGDFRELSNIVEENNIVVESNMLMAMVAIEKHDYNKAIIILSQINNDEAKWLKALCLLRLDEKVKARKIFEGLIEKNSLFSLESQDILEKNYHSSN